MAATRAQLVASLGFSFVAKLPGVLAIFVILPLISRSLGASTYGEFLSATALGTACTLPFSGIGTVGRRLLATAYGAHDRVREADVFISMFFLAGVSAFVTCGVAYAGNTHPVVILVSWLPIAVAFLSTADNMRAGYNEHYITAILQFAFQLAVYGLVFLVGVPENGILFSGFALQAPSILASTATLMLLLFHRPYLLRGKVHGIRRMMIPMIGVIAADGSLSALLNFSVYWLGRSGDTEYAAWLGTFVRLFQTFAALAMMLLLPITSYISIHWQNLSDERRLLLHKRFLLSSAGYGVVVGLVMAMGGAYYIKRMFALTVEGDAFDIASIALVIAAVIALKSYALLLYSISEARRVSFATAGIALSAFVVAAVASFWLSPAKTVDVLFLATGTLLPMLMIVDNLLHQTTRQASLPMSC